MTRGQIAIITPECKIMTSTEFNGDIYFEGHGHDVFDNLECVETVANYKEFVEKFNEDNYGYDRQLFYDCDDDFFDMKSDYFGKWFSDYVYIKNLSDKPVVFTDANGKNILLDTDGYGNLANVKQSDFECLIDDLVLELEQNITVPYAKQEACL